MFMFTIILILLLLNNKFLRRWKYNNIAHNVSVKILETSYRCRVSIPRRQSKLFHKSWLYTSHGFKKSWL